MTNIAELFGLPDGPLVSETRFIAGMECEIESLRGPQYFHKFTTTQDGSLRNNGYEFVSYPMPKSALVDSFLNLQRGLVFYDQEEAFSERTSTHVHVNCLGLSPQQVKNILFIYALMEEFFFVVAGQHRKNNIHCVPLTYTYLPVIYKADLPTLVNRWHKYTALNILPLAKQGTIEFRHLIGTGDVDKVEEWLTCLENLWHVAQNVEITPEFLCDSDKVKRLWFSIFSHCKSVMALECAFDSLIGNQLIDVKFAFV